ncbi:MAG: UDP-3-O-(3-hydroxymyristoyl)glucosamine N-acyltransferase [Thermodesulfobacteriota bacterium]
MLYENKDNSYYASEIAEFLGLTLRGENCEIYQPCSMANPKNNSIMFLTDSPEDKNYDFIKLNNFTDVLLILPDSFDRLPSCSYIMSKDPKLDFTKMLYEFFVDLPKKEIHPRAIIEKGAILGSEVSIGAGSIVGPEVSIGDNTIISSNTVISGKVTIGKNCVIKSNATIGSEGFNFILDRKDLIHMPQLGEIIIEDHVWIGANSTIERATLDQTVIGSHVKIDDLVQIGDGATIGKHTEIAAGSIVCRKVRIGERCWIAPNVTINSGVNIEDRAMVGLGTVVLKSVESDMVVCGNPAKILRSAKLLNRR